MGLARDMGLRLIEAAEHLTGREVAPSGTLDLVESYRSDNRVLKKTLEFVGFKLFNFQDGQTKEMRPQARRMTIQKALTAFAEDPMAGEYVDLYVSFVFGRGVPRPQAYDDEVQAHLDKVWDDSENKRVLTSFEKLIEKGIDFCIQQNVLFTFFDEGEDGMVRVSLLHFDDVEGVRRHPRFRFRILYYKVIERPLANYDWSRGAEVEPLGGNTTPKLVYYEALGAFDEDNSVMRAMDEGIDESQLHPPEALRRPGKVYHLAGNKTSEDAFGIPGMRRYLRWWTAHNEVLDSHVDRMKAMASVYMKATVKGTDRDLERLGEMATGRTSRFGTATIPGELPEPTPAPQGPGILGQNEGLNYEPFKIDSGAADVAASIPQLRAQFSGVFPPTYYGQEAAALAGAQSVELPVLKFIERDQELWAGLLRSLADSSIEKGVEQGFISEYRDPTDEEQARIDAARASGDEPEGLELNDQGQVKRDLGYELAFPSPLKRAMGDVVSAAIQVATAVDPNGTMPELSRWLFAFCLAEAFDVEDPMRIVDQVLPRELARAVATGQVQIDPETGEPITPQDLEGSIGPDGQRHPADNPGGAPRKTPNPEDRRVTETPHEGRRRSRATVRHTRRVTDAFDEEVVRAAREHLGRLGDVRLNGHGP